LVESHRPSCERSTGRWRRRSIGSLPTSLRRRPHLRPRPDAAQGPLPGGLLGAPGANAGRYQDPPSQAPSLIPMLDNVVLFRYLDALGRCKLKARTQEKTGVRGGPVQRRRTRPNRRPEPRSARSRGGSSARPKPWRPDSWSITSSGYTSTRPRWVHPVRPRGPGRSGHVHRC
jgi:hypothetical protein